MINPSDILNIVTDLLIRYSFQVIAAVVILIAGVLCARVTGRFIERSLQKSTIEKHLQQLLVRAAKVVVLLFTAILALDKFGVRVTALVAGLSVAGVGGRFRSAGSPGKYRRRAQHHVTLTVEVSYRDDVDLALRPRGKS